MAARGNSLGWSEESDRKVSMVITGSVRESSMVMKSFCFLMITGIYTGVTERLRTLHTLPQRQFPSVDIIT